MEFEILRHATFSDIHAHIGTGGCPWWRELGWPNPTIKTMVRHIKHDRIDELWVIADSLKVIDSLKSRTEKFCKIQSFFWVHDIDDPEIAKMGRGERVRLVNGIKVHPQVDAFELTAKKMEKVTRLARRFRLPVIFHTACCDREDHGPEKEMADMHLTAPHKYEELIAKNPDIPFVIGHGGSYAPTRLGPPTDPSQNCPGRAFWRENKKPYTIRFLIEEALRISRDYSNAFYDTSVSTNPGKAQLIADFTNENPGVAKKILVGTDYPIQWARCPTQVAALMKKGLRDELAAQIVGNRFSKIITKWGW